MKKQKQNYVSPETETLVVRFEGVICGSNPAKAGSSFSSSNASVEDDSDEDWGW